MLNRRHLRIKVLQALYAWFQIGETDFAKGEKELMTGINRIYDLYVYYFLMFGELVTHASNKIEEARSRKLPTKEDLHPNMRFVENQLFAKIIQNKALQAEAQKRKINWNNEQDLVRKVFGEIRNTREYEAFMNEPSSTFERDKEYAISLFKDQIANSEALLNYFEEQAISWLDDIDLVCGAVIKSIKSFDANSDEFTKLMPLFKDEEEDKHFVKELFKKTIVQSDAHEALISSKTENWEMERIAAMDMLLMKMAITEVREFPTIPIKVTLNEYIEISKFYSTPKSNGFINGILDKVFIELKGTGDIKKVGRGLIEE
jgi:transcription antitermination protein NusB